MTLNTKLKTTNSLVRLGDKKYASVPSISTNLPVLDDELIGTGGIPRGRIIEFFGPESCGKTTLALHIAGCEQKADGLVAFVDAEHAINRTWAERLGVNVDDLILSQPDCGEDALETVEALVISRAVSLIIVDSVAALVPRVELDGAMGDSCMGVQARLMSQACRKLTGLCDKNGVTVIFINQIREKLGVMFGNPETTTGGRALKFYSSVRFDMRRKEVIKDGEDIIGHKIHVKCVKNKVGPPLRETDPDIELIYTTGFNTFKNFIDYAVTLEVLERSGKWYKFAGENIGDGIKNTVAALEADPALMANVKSAVDAKLAARRK